MDRIDTIVIRHCVRYRGGELPTISVDRNLDRGEQGVSGNRRRG